MRWRTAAAAGCRGLIACGADIDLWNPNAIRNSSGAIFELPCVASTDHEVQAWLREHAVTSVATIVENAEPLWSLDLPAAATAVVIGPEHEGLSLAWIEACTHRTTIPIDDSCVDSLNASMTLGIVLFELRRRRHG